MLIQAVLEHQRTLNNKRVLKNVCLDCGVMVNYSLKTKISWDATRFLSGAADTKRTNKDIKEEV